MKKKEGILIILILVLLVVCASIFIIKNHKKDEQQEYVPQQEISDEQFRQTIVTLYFKDKEGGRIATEARKVDVVELVKDPYKYLLEQLINGPKNSKLEKLIPEGVKLNGTEMNNECLIVNLSKEFIDNAPTNEDEQKLLLKSIINTLTELTEVNYVKLIIDGNEIKGFNNSNVTFEDKMQRVI